MKNLFKNSVYAAAALVLALGAASCSDSDGDYTFADEREEALKDAAVDFVDNNVIPTYKALADGSIALQEDCEAMLEAFDAGTLTTPLVQAACNDWITTRKHWELSEPTFTALRPITTSTRISTPGRWTARRFRTC